MDEITAHLPPPQKKKGILKHPSEPNRYIGKGELAKARSMARRVIVLTLASSVTLGAILFVLCGAIPRAFTTDTAVLSRLGGLLPLLALQQPLVAVTLVVEGLLIGAGQVRSFVERSGTWDEERVERVLSVGL